MLLHETLEREDQRLLDAEAFKTTVFAFRVFPRVLDPHIMSLKETIKLKTGLDLQQPLQVGLRKPLVLLLLGGQSLQYPAR
jgi:hypothetical protein